MLPEALGAGEQRHLCVRGRDVFITMQIRLYKATGEKVLSERLRLGQQRHLYVQRTGCIYNHAIKDI